MDRFGPPEAAEPAEGRAEAEAGRKAGTSAESGIGLSQVRRETGHTTESRVRLTQMRRQPRQTAEGRVRLAQMRSQPRETAESGVRLTQEGREARNSSETAASETAAPETAAPESATPESATPESAAKPLAEGAPAKAGDERRTGPRDVVAWRPDEEAAGAARVVEITAEGRSDALEGSGVDQRGRRSAESPPTVEKIGIRRKEKGKIRGETAAARTLDANTAKDVADPKPSADSKPSTDKSHGKLLCVVYVSWEDSIMINLPP
ncbi:MAG: hypothetical protein HY319_26160 [Armatimonadetes bacterium]|nr:hypothetical protein [Armatimonadota bacterium]